MHSFFDIYTKYHKNAVFARLNIFATLSLKNYLLFNNPFTNKPVCAEEQAKLIFAVNAELTIQLLRVIFHRLHRHNKSLGNFFI